ncbi:MAG: O-antigen ligase family protein [Candidatus Daviesbacteria bacterium]|nr:O-antigen ligase family protein [Candidatus Daviesbacteria bacterium]
MLSKILTYSFYLLFALTPLIWLPQTSELFEFNKMIFVYLLTIVITACWLLKMIDQKKIIISKTPLDIPLLIFLGANILSTIFSIDLHVSIWGYYSRSNGGLLSLISYLILYWALVSNFTKEDALNFLKAGIFGGIIVSLWAIPEHFGASPSCLILTGNFDASCWVQDVQARVFATLGQPNWLSAYLAMLIFPALYFLLTSTKKSSIILYSIFLILFYMAFTFTYSRGATLGLIGGMAVFLSFFIVSFLRKQESRTSGSRIKYGMTILLIFLLINLLFGSALTDFKLISKFAPPSRPSLTTNIRPSGTQLENGGTESGSIRLIVWQGAWEIFKHNPILGSGVETFAYSYYQYRPVAHNLTSEWDFLYNKAHNEFLNYLATTGIVGFGTYMLIIGTFIFWCIKHLVIAKKFTLSERSESNGKQSAIPNKIATSASPNRNDILLVTLILASYISYLIQNFFGFSVVITALFFYLFPALAFMITGSGQTRRSAPTFLNFIFKHTTFAKTIILIIAGILIIIVGKNFLADTYYNEGQGYNDTSPGKAYNKFLVASTLNPWEPLYKSELAFAAASSAVAFGKEDATASSNLKSLADKQTDLLLQEHPHNTSLFRTAIRTYYQLSALDPSFMDKTLQTLDQTILLSPTDPKLLFNKAVILSANGKNQEAIKALQQAIKFKPNYLEAKEKLKELEK